MQKNKVEHMMILYMEAVLMSSRNPTLRSEDNNASPQSLKNNVSLLEKEKNWTKSFKN